ncbi:MAG: Gfo/Idh/MocA family oxidoreductase [Chloroflexi bacterium]|nr:Gfo/Idh/MocA family oxidoreductase [Chloroflexota bacterium]MCL5273547.1 Gfo/Idh/MocA family oxidoreductase [Chloroflexota bacterium]
MTQKVRVGVFGGRRGGTMIDVMSRHPDAQLVAICDFDPAALQQARILAEKNGSQVSLYQDFDQFINHDMDAVVLANYATEHAPYAVRLLDSGRHVTSEVLACQTLAEAVALVEAVERSGKVYTYAENYCYFRGTMEMQRLFRQGDLGEFLHGEGEYVHDCESIWVDITRGQRDHWRNWIPATYYCTHAIGPILTITGARPTRVSAYETPNVNKRRFGCRSGDGSVIVCQMDNGATAKFLPWANFKRHPESIWYAVYGSKGMMETDRWGATFNRLNVFIEDDSGAVMERSYHPKPRLETDLARSIGGHGGSDFFTMHFFLDSILDRPGKEYAIDVYQALDMTLPGILGYRSIWEGNIPMVVPDLRNAALRDKYRGDRWCCDPKMRDESQPTASCSHGAVEIPESIYEHQAVSVKR